MSNSSLTAECNKIFDFWKLEEYFTPSDYPGFNNKRGEKGYSV